MNKFTLSTDSIFLLLLIIIKCNYFVVFFIIMFNVCNVEQNTRTHSMYVDNISNKKKSKTWVEQFERVV